VGLQLHAAIADRHDGRRPVLNLIAVEPTEPSPDGRLHGPSDPYTELRGLFDERDRTDLERTEQWALAEARHNDRLRTAGQRLAEALASLRSVANSDQIDALLNVWRHAQTR